MAKGSKRSRKTRSGRKIQSKSRGIVNVGWNNTGFGVIGVDPGKTGALVHLSPDGEILAVLDMPIVTFPNSKAWYIDGDEVRRFIETANPSHVAIELVASRPGQGIASSFQFGGSYHALVAIALACRCHVSLVAPATWKRYYALIGTDKDAARKAAIQRWGDARFKRKKDVGRADAALLARFILATRTVGTTKVLTR